MLPEPHVCCKCKREVVWTDCLPAICYLCRARERQAKEEAEPPRPLIVERPDA